MEGNPVATLDYWRRVFRGVAAAGDGDIFDVIENAILVAAADCPREFRERREHVAEKLFTASASRCLQCDREEGDGSVKRDADKESKVVGCSDGPEDLQLVLVSSNYSYDEAEALAQEIDEDSQIAGEVLRIRQVLLNVRDQSDSTLFESLRRLQLMQLSVETMKATEIGRAVNALRKHNSKQIRLLARTLILEWKSMVDEWVNSTADIAGRAESQSLDDVDPTPSSLDEEHGLPMPPLDEGAMLAAAHETSIKLSEFFDEMDDDGNFRRSSLNRDARNRQEMLHPFPPSPWRPTNAVVHDMAVLPKSQEPVATRQKYCCLQVGTNSTAVCKSGPPGRMLKSGAESRTWEVKHQQHQHPRAAPVARNRPMAQTDKPKCSEEVSVQAKLEASKRKLHEGYRQAENMKKQRTVQVMELRDIPKLDHKTKQSNMKPKNHFRNWANGRH